MAVISRLLVLVFALCVPATAVAQSLTIEGTWVILPDRADPPLMGRPPGVPPEDLFEGRLSIRLSGQQVVVQTSAGSRVVSRGYVLNGSDADLSRATIHDGLLVLQRLEILQLPAEEAEVETRERYAVQADGTLLLERRITVNGRSSTRRHVFQRTR